MKRWLFLLKMIWITALGSPSLISSANESPPDLGRIQARGTLKIALPAEDVPPFFFVDDSGKLRGIDVDIAQDIAQRLKVTLVIDRQSKNFDEVVENIRSKRNDLAVSKLSRTLNRAQKVSFSNTYLTLRHTVLVNRLKFSANKNSGSALEKLNHPSVKVGVHAHSSFVEFAQRDFHRATLVQIETKSQLFEALKNGKVDFVLTDQTVADTWIKQDPAAAIKIQTLLRKDRQDPLSFIVHWQDHQFLNWLNIYIEIARKDETLSKIFNKYGVVVQ